MQIRSFVPRPIMPMSVATAASQASAPQASLKRDVWVPMNSQKGARPSTLPAAIPPLGQLTFYEERIADFRRRHPDLKPPTYYTDYAEKYVHRFTEELAPHLSPQGQVWLARARRNLQVAIETERAKDPAAFDRLERDDKAFTHFAYESHRKAYLDAGLATLPVSDLAKIAMTPDTKDLFTPMALEQAVATGAGAAKLRLQHDVHEEVHRLETGLHKLSNGLRQLTSG